MNDLSVCEEEDSLLGLQAGTLQQLLHVISPFVSPVPAAEHMTNTLLLLSHATQPCLNTSNEERPICMFASMQDGAG